MMSNWTISRRIIAGFITIVLITVGVGGFALWRLEGLGRNISDLADHTLPRGVGAKGGGQSVAG
jgi:CHASE3 domain sensor protein